MLGENVIVFALLGLIAVGLGLIYYSVALTESAKTEIGNLENFPQGSLVKISGEITKISKSKTGNVYWTVDDGTGIIVVPFLGSIADAYRNVEKNSLVSVSGLVSEYNGELEITPKEVVVE